MNKGLLVLAMLLVVAPIAKADISVVDISGDLNMWGFYSDSVITFTDSDLDQDDFYWTELYLTFTADLADEVMTKVTLFADYDWDGTQYDANDVVRIDEALLKVAKIYGSNLTITLGRQYLKYGEGFIIANSNPQNYRYGGADLDSRGRWRTNPFDAIVLSWDLDCWKLDLLTAKAVESRNANNDDHDGLADGDADLYALYATYSGVQDQTFDLYAAYMTDDTADAAGVNLWTAGSSGPCAVMGTYGELSAFVIGGRAAGATGLEGLSYKAELAYEFGDFDIDPSTGDADVDALGGYAGLKYAPEANYNPYIGLTFTYLEGSDDDDDYDTWIQLFEGEYYGEIIEGVIGTNLMVFHTYAGLDFTDKLGASLHWIYAMLDDEDGITGNITTDSDTDDEVGNEIDAYLDYQFNEALSAQLGAGVMLPGDAFADDYDDDAYFVRGLVSVSF